MSQEKDNVISDKNVGLRLKQERALQGYSQESLATALNVSAKTVGRYEKGAPIQSNVLIAMSELGLDSTYILTGQNKEFRANMEALRLATDAVTKVDGLTPQERQMARDLLVAIYAGRGDVVGDMLRQMVHAPSLDPVFARYSQLGAEGQLAVRAIINALLNEKDG